MRVFFCAVALAISFCAPVAAETDPTGLDMRVMCDRALDTSDTQAGSRELAGICYGRLEGFMIGYRFGFADAGSDGDELFCVTETVDLEEVAKLYVKFSRENTEFDNEPWTFTAINVLRILYPCS